VQWFSRKPSDFDELSKRVIDYGDNLAPDHPGYHDAEYRQRRCQSGLLALQYRHGRRSRACSARKRRWRRGEKCSAT
jgi:phenylalanine-4-hydroxylase